MTKESLTKEEVNRVIAERVMGWWLDGDTFVGKRVTGDHSPFEVFGKTHPNDEETPHWNPSDNPAQFNEAFAKAGEELIEKFLIAWIDAQEGEAWLDGPDDAIESLYRKYGGQLPPDLIDAICDLLHAAMTEPEPILSLSTGCVDTGLPSDPVPTFDEGVFVSPGESK